MKAFTAWLRIFQQDRVANVTSFVIGIAYLLQSWSYAIHQISVLDEGSYLMKGLLFASGRYVPFADYSVQTNQMPLAFFIPGWVQILFGPGLRTGRYFSILLGVLMIIGLWLLVRRLSGPWWAAAALAVVALNPALIKIYSVAVSQVLIVALLVWTLVFALGKDRSLWQLSVACALAAAMWLTRINMAPVLIFLLAYIYWTYGRQIALQCSLVGLGIVAAVHVLYWPGILKLWAHLIPDGVSPFLNQWRLSPGAIQSWAPELSLQSRVNSLTQALRINFIPITGFVASVLMWFHINWKKDAYLKRIALFLIALFAVLFVAHAFVSIGGDYCVYCLQVYLPFFDVLVIVLLAIVIPRWNFLAKRWLNFATALVILGLSALVGYGLSETLSNNWLRPRLVRDLLGVHWFNGVELWVIIQNKYGLDYQQIVVSARHLILIWVPVVEGFILAMIVLLVAQWLRPKGSAKQTKQFSFAARAWILFFLVAMILTPTPVLAGSYRLYDCQGDVLSSYERVGNELAKWIPEDSLVYWSGGESAVPLLYIPNARIFHPQINDGYSFYFSGNTDELERFGYWDEPLRTQWLETADFLLIEDRFYDEFWVNTGDWTHLSETSPADACREGAGIHILQRVSP